MSENQERRQITKCPICGKEFWPAPFHAYKINTSTGRRKLVCSYTCMRTWEKEKEAKKKAQKENKQ